MVASQARILLEGHAALSEFALDREILHLSHGAFGATPVAVLAEQQRWRERMERATFRFFLDDLPVLLRQGATEAATRFGGDADGWVFVENATAAVNAVLNSVELKRGDEVVTTSHAYGAVLKTLMRRTQQSGAEFRIATIRAPISGENEILEAINSALTERTRLLVVDHVASQSALIFPVRAIVTAAHAKGVPVLVDGAHAPGMLTIDVLDLGADWYTGNIHKWMFAPKGCAVLWTRQTLRERTHAHITSHGWGTGYTAEFDWTGTRDPSPWLCLPLAARTHDEFGGASLSTRNIALATDAGSYLSRKFDAPLSGPSQLCGSMASLRLKPTATLEESVALQHLLNHRYNIEAAIFSFQDELWLRISAQIYNEMSDYERLARILAQVLSG